MPTELGEESLVAKTSFRELIKRCTLKILLATDGTKFSQCAAEAIAKGPMAAGTEVKMISVVHARIPTVPDPTMTGMAIHEESLADAREEAVAALDHAAEYLEAQAPDLKLSRVMPQGSPKEEILAEAERWGADLVVLGSHGRGPVRRFLLGSVSHSLALHAPCSVEIVRCRGEFPEAGAPPCGEDP